MSKMSGRPVIRFAAAPIAAATWLRACITSTPRLFTSRAAFQAPAAMSYTVAGSEGLL